MTRLSVVLPTRNAEHHVERALESVREQTYEGFECLVIDDSTDRTHEIVRSIDDDRVRLLDGPGEGVAAARNAGIEAARGEYVACHDADDWSLPARFERQVAFLDAHSEVALVGTGAWLVDRDGERIALRRVRERVPASDLVPDVQFVHGSVVCRREALEAVGGYDESLPVAEDYDLYLRLTRNHELRNIDWPLYAFRIHPGSLYEATLEETKLYHWYAIRREFGPLSERARERIDSEGIEAIYGYLTDRERHAYHRELAQEFLRYGNADWARPHACRAIRVAPSEPMGYALFALGLTGDRAGVAVARAYRRFVNRRIRRVNDNG